MTFKKISSREWKSKGGKSEFYINLYVSPNLGIKTYALNGEAYSNIHQEFSNLNEAKQYAKSL